MGTSSFKNSQHTRLTEVVSQKQLIASQEEGINIDDEDQNESQSNINHMNLKNYVALNEDNEYEEQ